LPSPNYGAQIAVFTGTPTALTQVWVSPTSCGASGNAQVPPGCSVTSSNFSVAANSCAYIAVDGFAGDACDYTVTLSNVDCPCNLPVELISFSAECAQDKLLVKWETGSEYNSNYFTIEKSFDGITFHPVKQVQAAGNSNTIRKYLVALTDLPMENSYYRLSQTDFDGTTKTFTPVSVKGCGNDNITAYSSGNEVFVTVNSKTVNSYHIVIYDMHGKLVFQKNELFPAGKNTAAYSINAGSGVYYLKVYNEQNLQMQKISIQR
jgi:hypothetical protein